MSTTTSDIREAKDSPLTAAERAVGQAAAIRANLFMICANNIVIGSVMMLYATDVLGFSGKRIASILALAPLAALLRIPLMHYAERLGLQLTLKLASWGNLAVVLVLILCPAAWLPYSAYLGLLVLFASMIQLGWGMAWQPLLRGITTVSDRGRFFARMRFLFSVVTSTVMAIIPLMVGEHLTEWQYKGLLCLAALGIMNFSYWVGRIPHGVSEPLAGSGPRHRGLELVWHILRTSPLLRRPLVIHILLALAGMPLFVVYLRQMLHYPASLVSAFIFVGTAGSAVSLLFWGRVADTVGFRPMLIGTMLLSMVTAPLNLLLVPAAAGAAHFAAVGMVSVVVLLVLGLLGGMLSAGVGIATTTIQHYHVRHDDSVEAMNLFALILVAFTSLNSLWSGFLLDNIAMPAGSLAIAGQWCHFDWVKGFLLVAGLGLPALVILLTLGLPNARPSFGLSDFFSSLAPDAMRTLLVERQIYHENETKRADAARWLGAHPGPLAIDPLTDMLLDPAYDVKVEAIRALARTESPVAGDRLLGILSNPEKQQVADHAAWALGELGYRPAFDALVKHLDASYAPRIRAMAARALGKLGDPRALGPLVDLLVAETASQHVTASACWAVIRLGGVCAHAPLVFGALHRLTPREERYEIMDNLCEPLGIPHGWLLRFNEEPHAFAALEQHIAHRPPKWREARRPIIDALHNRNLAAARDLLHAAVAGLDPDAPPLIRELASALEASQTWQSVAVLACAWLLLRDD